MGYAYEKELQAERERAEKEAEAKAARVARAAERKAERLRKQIDREKEKRRLATQEAELAAEGARRALTKTAEKLVRVEAALEARRGCPEELSETLIEELCSDIEKYPLRAACENNGISTAKLNSWRAKAATPGAHPLLIELDRRVAGAKARGDIELYDKVESASNPITGTDKNGRDILLQRADAKVLLELARARMPELSPRTIVPVEEKKIEDNVDFRHLMTDEQFEKYLAGKEAEDAALALAASNEMRVRMGSGSRPIDTEGESVPSAPPTPRVLANLDSVTNPSKPSTPGVWDPEGHVADESPDR